MPAPVETCSRHSSGSQESAVEARAYVAAALGVVRLRRQQLEREASRALEVRGVEVVDREREAAGVAADLVQAEQAVVAVERRVLDALRHHGRRRLLEADDERVVAALLEGQDRREPARQSRLGDRLTVERRRPRRCRGRRRCGRRGTTRARAGGRARSSIAELARAASRPRARTSSAPARASPRARSPRTGAARR